MLLQFETSCSGTWIFFGIGGQPQMLKQMLPRNPQAWPQSMRAVLRRRALPPQVPLDQTLRSLPPEQHLLRQGQQQNRHQIQR